MGKKGKPGHRVRGGKKVQARKRARQSRLAAALLVTGAVGGPNEEAAVALASAGRGPGGGAAGAAASYAAGSRAAESALVAVASPIRSSGAAEESAVALALTSRRAAGGPALAVVVTMRGASEVAAVPVASASAGAAEESADAVVPAGGEEAGADAGAPRPESSSRSLRRQRASASAAARRLRLGAASEASVEAALLPSEFAPRPLTSGVGAGCTAREIDALPLVSGQARARPGEGDVCVVCQEGIGGGDTLHELPCLHVLHPGCTHGWLTRQNRCPLCSLPVVMCVEC